MERDEVVLYYKIFRVALLVATLYGIIAFLWFTNRGKHVEDVAMRILEED